MVSVPPGVGPPVTVPELIPTEAMALLLLVHVPPVVASFRFVVAPGQMLFVPVIPGGVGFTVTVVVTEQPPLV